jgi:hypothetical protein
VGKWPCRKKKETEKKHKKQLSLPSLSLASPFPQHPVSPGQERAKIRDRIFEKYVYFGSQTHNQYTKLYKYRYLHAYLNIYIYIHIHRDNSLYG